MVQFKLPRLCIVCRCVEQEGFYMSAKSNGEVGAERGTREHLSCIAAL